MSEAALDRYIPKVNKTEEGVHKRVCSYLRKHYPHVIFNSDYAAGLFLTKNQSQVRQQLNSGRGYPDLFIAHPSKHTLKREDGSEYEVEFHGLYLELKQDGVSIYVTRGPQKGKLVADPHIREQAAVLQRLNKLGYFARFAVGYDQAAKIIDWYFNAPEPQSLF